MAGGTAKPFSALSLERVEELARHTRRWAERVVSSAPGDTITLNEFVGAYVLVYGSLPDDDMLHLKLHIVNEYLARGHSLTEEENRQYCAEKEAWEQQKRKFKAALDSWDESMGTVCPDHAAARGEAYDKYVRKWCQGSMD
ncbi:hypothetical protein AURDEDRAFT_128792 [Auricularia subglabra TFB-10046 SS5]|nr:hypothetical protein AURDEDRAFT_128792 [Auricularia subglabra TFB-10046 SS5]